MKVRLEVEQWKKIKGFNFYLSNKGRVKNKDGKIKKLTKGKNGYLCFTAWNSEESKKYLLYVHRLVAAYFLPIEDYNECVNHKDGNKENNCVENLEWCSLAYNTKHAYENGLIQNYRSIEVIETGQKFKSIAECVKWLKSIGYEKARHSNIVLCIQGKRHIAYGHTYRYI